MTIDHTHLVASISGVHPVLVWWLTDECLSMSSPTTSSWPYTPTSILLIQYKQCFPKKST